MTEHKPVLLVIDDEEAVRTVLRKCFENESYGVLEAFDPESALNVLSKHPVDLITLDVNLDGQDGLSLARDIRTRSNVPIIMVSGKGELIDTVVGLEVGADDYITKPFELREVLARVKSALRRSRLNSDVATLPPPTDTTEKALYFDNFKLSVAARDLIATDGTACELTSAEYNLLSMLVSHPGQVLSRDQIMDDIKGADWNPTDRTIDNQIARLRKKLDSLGISGAIKTVRGVGYKFTCNVERR